MPEADTMHPRNNPHLRTTLTLFFLLAFGGPALPQQNPAVPLPAKQQPPINVDHDPVPVPPPGGPPAPGAAAPAGQQAGQVARGKNGGYTLTRDVDEVVLSATVIDEHSRLVQGLHQDDFHVFEDGKPQ